jgi:diaphanous 1
LLKHLLSLRVTLSTAKLAWISDFVAQSGFDALQVILEKIDRQPREQGDLNEQVIGEVIKCLRVLMNTQVRTTFPQINAFAEPVQVGFVGVLDRPAMVQHIVFCLRTPSPKVRSQVCDLLAALCVMSPDEGHHHVLDAFSELRIAFEDGARFEWLLKNLAGLEPVDENGPLSAVWEWRTSAMALVNALCNSPDDLERRCEIRGELQRRGLFDSLEVRLPVAQAPDAR